MSKLGKLDDIIEKCIRNYRPKNEVEYRIKETLKRIAYEYKICVQSRSGYEYFPLQQFRLLMEKIVNVVNLRKFGTEYYNYLEYVTESTAIEKGWDFIQGKIDSISLETRSRFHETNPLRKNNQYKGRYYHKFYLFEYDYKSWHRDSSLVIHDDNSTYKMKVTTEKIAKIKSIVLFFISNLFIPIAHKKKSDKYYLKKIYNANKEKIIDSGLIKKDAVKELKEIVRHAS